jgi:phospho-N-acetylmuramoyl-pentapeptide-transferase
MLYWLSAFSDTIGPLNVLRYITFRTGAAMTTAFVLVLLLGPFIVAMLQRGRDRPVCPTGLIALPALLAATLLWARFDNPYVWIVIGVTLGFGLIGLHGDYLRANRRLAVPDTLSIAMVASIALVACFALVRLGGPRSATGGGLPPGMSWFYVAVAAVLVVAAADVVKLADRLQRGVSRPLLVAALSFLLIACLVGNSVFANYLDLRHVPGVGELAVLCGAMVGAGLGFIWLNAPAAARFMGDSGSLALGGVLGTVAVATRHEIVLALISSVFVFKPSPTRG